MKDLINHHFFSPYLRVYRVGKILDFVDRLLSRLRSEISVLNQDQNSSSLVHSEILLLMSDIDWEFNSLSLYNQSTLKQTPKDCELLSLPWKEYVDLAAKSGFTPHLPTQLFLQIPDGSQKQNWSTYSFGTQKLAFFMDQTLYGEIIMLEDSFLSTGTQNQIPSGFYINSSFNELQAYVSFLDFIRHQESSFIDQIFESIQEDIMALKKRLSYVYCTLLANLSKKFKSKHGISKRTEGYIPFLTWARGNIIPWLVNKLFVDKLSQQLNFFIVGSSNGCF